MSRQIVRAIREHIKTCPLLKSDNHGFGVDFLAEDGTAYMLESVPGKPVIKRYINGDVEKQLVFAFSTRESYGPNAGENLKNLEFFEDFADWLFSVSTLPSLGAGCEPKKYEVLSEGYAYHTGADLAQYRMQCRLIYLQKGI